MAKLQRQMQQNEALRQQSVKITARLVATGMFPTKRDNVSSNPTEVEVSENVRQYLIDKERDFRKGLEHKNRQLCDLERIYGRQVNEIKQFLVNLDTNLGHARVALRLLNEHGKVCL